MPTQRKRPNTWYASLCTGAIAAAYVIYFGTSWGDPGYGPGGWYIVARNAALVLAAYSTIELYRQRITLWPVGVPWVFILGWELYSNVMYCAKWGLPW